MGDFTVAWRNTIVNDYGPWAQVDWSSRAKWA